MFVKFRHDTLEQKTLFYKLANAFNMENDSIKNEKVCGIYAIFHNDLCLYVGQSKNMASRLATHIKGKYGKATDIYVWSELEEDLDDAEKSKMSFFKPIENVLIDMSCDEDDRKHMCAFEIEYKVSLKAYTVKNIERKDSIVCVETADPELAKNLVLPPNYHKKAEEMFFASLKANKLELPCI